MFDRIRRLGLAISIVGIVIVIGLLVNLLLIAIGWLLTPEVVAVLCLLLIVAGVYKMIE